MGKSSKDNRDRYYRQSKTEGYRARSAYKLIQIDDEHQLFVDATKVVDLCAAPGSWSQVLLKRLQKGAQIVAVDLQPMAPLKGVTQLLGDITQLSTARAIAAQFCGVHADLVVCDGAPDVTGLHDLDEHMQAQLLVAALSITLRVLKPGGTFIAKVFRGQQVVVLYDQLKCLFERVDEFKPRSSRASSFEAFVICRDLRFTEACIFDSNQRSAECSDDARRANPLCTIAPFVACGDLEYPAQTHHAPFRK